MLFSAIVTEIIKETGGDINDTDLQTLIFGFLKSALRRFPRHTRSRFILSTKSASLSSGNYSITLPTGFIRERSVYYIDEGERKTIDITSFDQFNELFSSTSTGSPKEYRIIGSTMEFTRSADKAYTIYIEGSYEIDDVLVTDTFIGDSSVVEILKDGTKYIYFSDYQEDQTKGAEKLSLFNSGLQQLESSFIEDELPDYVEEH